MKVQIKSLGFDDNGDTPYELVQLSLGDQKLVMSLDSAYDFQYQLAGFLASRDLLDYSSNDPSPLINASREALEAWAEFDPTRRIH